MNVRKGFKEAFHLLTATKYCANLELSFMKEVCYGMQI
jgi:hypothetical protein